MAVRTGVRVLVLVVGALGCTARTSPGDGGEGADAGECAGPQTCTQRGCTGPTGARQVELSLPVAAPMADLPGSAITGCREATCVTGTLVGPAVDGRCWGEFPPEEVDLKAYVLDPRDAGPPLLVAGWGSNFMQPRQLPDPQDGERFSVALTTPGGAVVAAAAAVATYRREYPNGPCCPPLCVYATLSMLDAGVDQ